MSVTGSEMAQTRTGRSVEALYRNEWPGSVESECGAVALGRPYLFPPLSSGGALVARP